MQNGVALRGADMTLGDLQDALEGSAGSYLERCDDTCELDPESELVGYGYACTRTPGHDGPHIAATGNYSVVAIWEDVVPSC